MSPAKIKKKRHLYQVICVSWDLWHVSFTCSPSHGGAGPERAARTSDGNSDSARPVSAPWRGSAAPAPDRSCSSWRWGRTWSSASVEINHTIQGNLFVLTQKKKKRKSQRRPTTAVNPSGFLISRRYCVIFHLCFHFKSKFKFCNVILGKTMPTVLDLVIFLVLCVWIMWFKMHKLYTFTPQIHSTWKTFLNPRVPHINESWGILWKFLNKHLMCLNT